MKVSVITPGVTFKADGNKPKMPIPHRTASRSTMLALLGTLATANIACPSGGNRPEPPATVTPIAGEAGTAGTGGFGGTGGVISTGGAGGATTVAPKANPTVDAMRNAFKEADIELGNLEKGSVINYSGNIRHSEVTKTVKSITGDGVVLEVEDKNAITHVSNGTFNEVWAFRNGKLTQDDSTRVALVEPIDGRVCFKTMDGKNETILSWENTPGGINVRNGEGEVIDLIKDFTITKPAAAETVAKNLKIETQNKARNNDTKWTVAKKDSAGKTSNFIATVRKQASIAQAKLSQRVQSLAQNVQLQARSHIANRRTAGGRVFRAMV